MKTKYKHYLISGRVQGVGYRAFAHRAAVGLGLRGWVRNLIDGRVELLAAGADDKLAVLEGHLAKGPAHAFVEGLQCGIVDAEFVCDDFNIVPDGEKAWSQKD